MLLIIAVVLTGWGRNTVCNAVLCKATCSTRLLLAACLDLTSFFWAMLLMLRFGLPLASTQALCDDLRNCKLPQATLNPDLFFSWERGVSFIGEQGGGSIAVCHLEGYRSALFYAF